MSVRKEQRTSVPNGTVAPYVRHEAFEETLASAAQPVWNPSHNVKIFLRSPGTQIAELNEYLATVHRIGLCSWCAEPLTWAGTRPKLTCSGKHRQARHKATKGRSEWIRENQIHGLLARLGDIDYPDYETRARHDRYMQMLAGTYRSPPRLGHARPRYDQTDSELQPDAHTTFSSVESMAWHDRMILRQGSGKDQAADKLADQWLKDHE